MSKTIQDAVEEFMKFTQYYDYKRRWKPALFGYTEGARFEREITKILTTIEKEGYKRGLKEAKKDD